MGQRTFISYSRQDSEFTLKLARDLREAGADIWMDRFDLSAGEDWDIAVEKALYNCGSFLLILSPVSVESKDVRDELNLAINEGKRIIPVIYKNCRIPLRIQRINYIDLTGKYDSGLPKLLKALGVKSLASKAPVKNRKQKAESVAPSASQEKPGLFSLDKFVKIPAGSFQMGSRKSGIMGVIMARYTIFSQERPVHTVRITKSFYMGKYPVIQEQWEAVMGNNPSRFKGKDLPVETVSWNDVQEFIQCLNDQTGRKIYRLPTEAEWEYACRAGTTGDYAGNLDDMAWYIENSDSKSHPVGIKQPNAWGLYDMHGNVWEWCSDWYQEDYYKSSPRVDPTGPDTGSAGVARGGGWGVLADRCRSALRRSTSPDARDDRLGFRLVRTA